MKNVIATPLYSSTTMDESFPDVMNYVESHYKVGKDKAHRTILFQQFKNMLNIFKTKQTARQEVTKNLT